MFSVKSAYHVLVHEEKRQRQNQQGESSLCSREGDHEAQKWKNCGSCHDGGHCFLKCKLIKRCWRLLEMEQTRLVLLSAKSAKDFVWNVLQLEQSLACKVSLLLWKWWDVRNKVNAGDPIQNIHNICHSILEMAGLLELPRMKIRPAARLQPRWLRPPQGVLKINTDGAFVQATKNGA
uniref:RNase H type-1 domain-containing protein n=1 Tax=Setaria viridis TaxID=4556 RepID=A0A4U6VGU3_SETVI|nr:hypothetical protein SEVIR_3G346300v2 [Setaria viridis]